MPSFGDSGVSWECVAREFRAKYTGDPGSSASLKAAQAAIEKVLPEVKKIDGLKEVKRAVCGGCGDVKLVVSIEDAKFGAWADMRGSGGKWVVVPGECYAIEEVPHLAMAKAISITRWRVPIEALGTARREGGGAHAKGVAL